jgi:hypothetical protein
MTSLVIWLRFFLFAKPNIFLLLARSKLVFYVASINQYFPQTLEYFSEQK